MLDSLKHKLSLHPFSDHPMTVSTSPQNIEIKLYVELYKTVSTIWETIFFSLSDEHSETFKKTPKKVISPLPVLLQNSLALTDQASALDHPSRNLQELIKSAKKTFLIAKKLHLYPPSYKSELLSRISHLFFSQFPHFVLTLSPLHDTKPDAALIQDLLFVDDDVASGIVQNILHCKLSKGSLHEAHVFAHKASGRIGIPGTVLERIDEALAEKALDTLSELSRDKFEDFRNSLIFCESDMEYATEILAFSASLCDQVRAIASLRISAQQDKIQAKCTTIIRELASQIPCFIPEIKSIFPSLKALLNARRIELCLLSLSFADPLLAQHVQQKIIEIRSLIRTLSEKLRTPTDPLTSITSPQIRKEFREEILSRFGFFRKGVQHETLEWGSYNQEDLIESLLSLLGTKQETPLLFPLPYEEESLLKREHLPSVKDLIKEYRSRPWSDAITLPNMPHVVRGFLPTANQADFEKVKTADRELFLKILEAHNALFCKRINMQKATDAGLAEKRMLEAKSFIYTTADKHSDLMSIIALIEFFEGIGALNAEKPDASFIQISFFGDYCDRGANDIEVLSLLLLLRMTYPQNISLLRGNHENVSFQQTYSNEGAWLKEHEEELTRCYASFPLVQCIGERNGLPDGTHEYIHCSHALFSREVDLAPLLESDQAFMTIPNTPAIAMSLSKKISTKSFKQQEAFARLFAHTSPDDANVLAYTWSDIGFPSGPSTFRCGARQLSPEDTHDYLRAASAKTHKLKFVLHGHRHELIEHFVAAKKDHKEKIIAVGLPVSLIGGIYKQYHYKPGSVVIDGFLMQVEPRVRDWTVYPTVIEDHGQFSKLVVLPQSFKLGKSITSATPC